MNQKQSVSAMLSMLLIAPAVAAEKPNVLFIVTDEHNFRTLGCYRDLLPEDQAEIWGKGNVVETPNIDRIADNGVIFDRMYCSAPVSSAARASMFTGYYGHQVNVPNNSNKPGDGKYIRAEQRTIAQYFQDAGYKTGYSGKLHLAEARGEGLEEWWQPYPVDHEGYNYGFEDNKYMFNGGHGKYIGIDDSGTPYFASKNAKPTNKTSANGFPIYSDTRSKNVLNTNDFLCERTLEFIEENKNKPFYYVVSIPDPHTPDVACGKYNTMYTHMEVEMPYTFNYSKENKDSMPKWQQPDGKAEVLKKALPQYFGMVKNIDDNIGIIIDKLEREGILENTIIIFTSDHGDLMGEHARMNKGTIHETSAKVPFVMCHGMKTKGSLVPRGKVVKLATNTTDWMPTFLALAGVECPEVMGRDLRPIMDGKKPAGWVDITFSQLGFVAAIDSRYKLSLNTFGQEQWLLDLEADPHEIKNFINDPAYRETIVRLAKELKAYNVRCNSSNEKIAAIVDKLIADRE
ncbi:MAG: sulfatase-like hydrolase/transferase [Rikenellaceae bacterium]